jgi:hypothetical protein
MNLDKKISTDLESVDFYEGINVHWNKFKSNQILLAKFNHRLLVTIGVYSRRNSPNKDPFT